MNLAEWMALYGDSPSIDLTTGDHVSELGKRVANYLGFFVDDNDQVVMPESEDAQRALWLHLQAKFGPPVVSAEGVQSANLDKEVA